MIELYIAEAKMAEVAAAERTLNFRREYSNLRRVDRLERALSTARGRLGLTTRN